MRPAKAARWFTFLLLAVCLVQPVSAAGSLKVDSVKKDLNEKNFSYQCTYPRLNGVQDNRIQQRINVIFKEQAESAMSLAQYASKRVEGGAPVKGQYSYEVKRNTGGLLSLVCREKLSAGGTAEKVAQSGATFNTVSGKTYRLHELFADHADYVGVISDEIGRQIAAKGLVAKQTAEFKKIRVNQPYYLTDTALVVFFGQNELFRTDCGVVEFAIPLSSLEGIVKSELRL